MINHPRTVWTVTTNHIGDIITGSEDYKIRTFTRDLARRDDGESSKDFEAEVKAASLGGTNVELDKLPGLDKLKTMKGKKDGEIKVFRNGDNAEAYVWKGDGNRWDKIGDVIMPQG